MPDRLIYRNKYGSAQRLMCQPRPNSISTSPRIRWHFPILSRRVPLKAGFDGRRARVEIACLARFLLVPEARKIKTSGKDFLYRLPSTFSPPLELSPLGAGPALCMARITLQDCTGFVWPANPGGYRKSVRDGTTRPALEVLWNGIALDNRVPI